MTIIPTGRLAAALRRYGRAARLELTPPVEIRLLVSDLAPLKHGDLPADGIRAEALALLPAEAASPREGDAITAGGTSWIVRSAVPVAATDTRRGGVFQLHLASAAGSAP